jgi:hypothetical protein
MLSGRDKKLATDRLSSQPIQGTKVGGSGNGKDGSNRNYKD